jgi:hypothetical protein
MYNRNSTKFFSKYPAQNSLVSLLLGVGIGFLLAYPVIGEHPLRWGVLFVIMGLAGFVWAGFQKTK